MFNRIASNNTIEQRRDRLSYFFKGFFAPYDVPARFALQEPYSEFVVESDVLVHSAWQDVVDALNVALVQYAEEN